MSIQRRTTGRESCSRAPATPSCCMCPTKLGITCATRNPALPHVPTLEESGIGGVDAGGWTAVMAPAKLPESVLRQLMQGLAACGVEVLVVTIDTPLGANRENKQRNGFSIPFKFSRRLLWDGVKHPQWSLNVFARTLLTGRQIPRFATSSPIRKDFASLKHPKVDCGKAVTV